MPQTDEITRKRIDGWFCNGADLAQPLKFLHTRGYNTTMEGWIFPPTPAHTVSEEEWVCIKFLCEEWDYCWPGEWVGAYWHQVWDFVPHGEDITIRYPKPSFAAGRKK